MKKIEENIINELENRGIEVYDVSIDDKKGKVIISVGYCCGDIDSIDLIRTIVSSHYNYNTLLLEI